MIQPNADLSADPMTDAELAGLEAQLRRDVLRNRPEWLGLLARMRASEHALATVRAQPKRDELAREVTRLTTELAGLELRYAERAVAANTAEAYLAQAHGRLRDAEAEQARVSQEHEDTRWQWALKLEEVRRLHQVEVEREQVAARLREADLRAQLERAERERGDRDAQRAAQRLLKDQLVVAQQKLDRHRAATSALRATLSEAFARLETD